LNISGSGNPFPPCIECQLKAGNAGDILTLGGTYIAGRTDSSIIVTPKKRHSSELPAGEWNKCDISVINDSITVFINDTLQNIVTGTSVKSGKIGLQSEGSPVEFRNISLVRK